MIQVKVFFKYKQINHIHVSIQFIEVYSVKSDGRSVKNCHKTTIQFTGSNFRNLKKRFSVKLKQADTFIVHTCIW